MPRIASIPAALLGLALSATMAASTDVTLGELHCNDAQGLPQRKGQAVTVFAVVTGQFSSEKSARICVQDATGAVTVYGSPKSCVALGDSVRVSGVVMGYRGLTEITGSESAPLEIAPLGKATRVPVPLPLTTKQIRATGEPGGCEPNESRLVEVSNVFIRAMDGSALPDAEKFKDNANYRLVPAGADSAETVTLRVGEAEGCDHSHGLEGQPIPTRVAVRITGLISQFTPQSSTEGGYQLAPRVREDIRPMTGTTK
jgi:hypothetical protein